MLQSMGWSEGKGLGATESGITTHVKVSKKSDQLGQKPFASSSSSSLLWICCYIACLLLTGVGAKKTTSDNWLENSSAFDSLLKSLNQNIAPAEGLLRLLI